MGETFRISKRRMKHDKFVLLGPGALCADEKCLRWSWNGDSDQYCHICRIKHENLDLMPLIDSEDEGSEPQCDTNCRSAFCAQKNCFRGSLNGRPGECCCRTCAQTNGQQHEPECLAIWGANGDNSHSSNDLDGEWTVVWLSGRTADITVAQGSWS